jgi:hypothetical protein
MSRNVGSYCPVDFQRLRGRDLLRAGPACRQPLMLADESMNSREGSSSAGGWKVIFDLGDWVLALNGNGKSSARF